MTTPERKAAYILAAIAMIEGAWVVLNAWSHPARFIEYLGFALGRSGTVAGWVAAAIVVTAFVGSANRPPSVRATMFRPSWLKVLGIAVAIAAGILEEVVFRKLLMDWLANFNSDLLCRSSVPGWASALSTVSGDSSGGVGERRLAPR